MNVVKCIFSLIYSLLHCTAHFSSKMSLLWTVSYNLFHGLEIESSNESHWGTGVVSLMTNLICSWMSFQINICVALSVVEEKAMLIRTVSKARLVLQVNQAVLQTRPQKTKALCHSRCCSIENPLCSKASGAVFWNYTLIPNYYFNKFMILYLFMIGLCKPSCRSVAKKC